MSKFTALSSRMRIGILAAILLLALAVRLWHIADIPPGLYPDEAQNAYDALRAARDGTWHLFYPDNNGREGLYINLVALSFLLFGTSVFALKIVGIIAGTATVLGQYLLTRTLLYNVRGADVLALISATLVAGSFWHINFSRIAFRAILLPLVLTFTFWLLLRAVHAVRAQRRAWHLFLLAGALFGIGFHTYIAWRIAPVAALILLIALLIFTRTPWRPLLRGAALFLIGSALTAAPLIATFATKPELLSSRSADVSVFALPPAERGVAIMHNILLAVGKYFTYGDQNWRHGYPPHATLEPVAGAFFAIGLAALCALLIRGIVRRASARTDDLRVAFAAFLLAWFILLLAPEFLTTEGLPHALRSIGTLPAVYAITAIGIAALWQVARYAPRRVATGIIILTFLLTAHTAARDTVTYFRDWAHAPQTAAAFRQDLTRIAHAINNAPEERVAVAVGPLERLVPRFLTADRTDVRYVDSADALNTEVPVRLYATTCDAQAMLRLRDRFAHIVVLEHIARNGTRYCTVDITP